MLSRTQYNVNDYFNKKVCGFYVSFGHGFEYDRIYPDLLKEQNSIPRILPNARFVTILPYAKGTWR
jgi:hypothetical protein